MVYKYERARREIIEQLKGLVDQKVSGKNVEIIQEFIDQFYQTISFDDLRAWSINDLYGSIMSFYDFFRVRKANEMKLRVYNPEFTANAWQSKHTVIEVITKDHPFIVDSLLMEINRMGYTTHIALHCGGIKMLRNEEGEVIKIVPYHDKKTEKARMEAPVYLEINRISNDESLEELQTSLRSILHDIDACVSDWQGMKDHVQSAITELDKGATQYESTELQESKDYLGWIIDRNFVLLGLCDYALDLKNRKNPYVAIPENSYGILSLKNPCLTVSKLGSMNRDPELFKDKSKILTLSKTNIKSSIHRPVYMESIGVPLLDEEGKPRGERIIIGMYTSIAYNRSTTDIPFLRHKVTAIMKATNFRPNSHGWKVLLNILETLPRDDLFQASIDELLDIALGIYYLQERRRIRLFARRDINGRFVSSYVYLPRDRFNTKLLRGIQSILDSEFEALESHYETRFTDSVLARIHFVLRIDPRNHIDYNLKDIERKIIEIGRSWDDDINSCLLDYFGEEAGSDITNRYSNAFPASYQENFNAVTALYDIRHIEKLSEKNPLELNIYKPIDDFTDSIRFKVYQRGDVIAISDALPILENMGMRVISERPYRIRRRDGDTVWINDFTMLYADELRFELQQLKELFQEAFSKVWFQDAENDGFNKLVLSCGLGWREIMMLRTYAKYFRQIGVPFSQAYVEQTLVNHTAITKLLVDFFLLRFDPETAESSQAKSKKISEKIHALLEQVESLDDDRILRHYQNLFEATIRTNYFQTDENGNFKNYLSIKLNPKIISDLPLPRPMFEIFVYSPRFEGNHLRGSKVARGGLRWSDRLEDYRTEVLGLMKAQFVKNAVIVPSGAKGVFVTKRLHPDATREEVIEEGIICYKNFITALLDITDNIKGGEVVPPEQVVRYDGDDTYLVVAADKGTATFSDIANSIAIDFDFWLKDAFASGGSTGYDHKKMGITARGAWESVKRHFRELDRDIQSSDFTCVGIGDMAGDVFGNGMLLSRHTKLVAAFNHLHIFIDPNPEPEASFRERQRMFNLPRSTWMDYNKDLISNGGGIYSRRDKFIELSPEARKVLGIKDKRVEPNKLISMILKAPVDLLWNGGIGTYVKSVTETSFDVGDRANNATRVNADDLRCLVVGEGGNLGFTQKARREFALNGGKIYTDFIDNAGGVDCSDHEVNIKILLNEVVESQDMTEKQRNQLLEEMTDDVAHLVLQNNYRQTQAISLAIRLAAKNLELHRHYIDFLEKSGHIDRELEHLPSDEVINERKVDHIGLTGPSLAVLLSYTKIKCKDEILASNIPEDEYLSNIIETAFPPQICEKYQDQLYKHSLRREIIATQISNHMVNEVGFSFVYRLQNETGAEVQAIVRAYAICRDVFELPRIWSLIEALDNKVSSDIQIDIMALYIRLIRRSARWILNYYRVGLDIRVMINKFGPKMQELFTLLPKCLEGQALNDYNTYLEKHLKQGVGKELAERIASVRSLLVAFDIIEAANKFGFEMREVAKVYFSIDEQLDINWIRTQVLEQRVENNWDALTRESLRDDLDRQQRKLTISILQHKSRTKDVHKRISKWTDKYPTLVSRWRSIVHDLQKSTSINFTMMFVAIRELLDLTQTSVQTTQTEAIQIGGEEDGS